MVISRDVAVSAVDDLALCPPRVALAAIVDDQIGVYPVRATLQTPADPASSTRIMQVPADTPDLSGRHVVVVADDGPEWFRLRSLTIRGVARAVGDHTYEVVPTRMVAWDYGALRESPTPVAATAPAVFKLTIADTDIGPPSYPPNLAATVDRARVMILASRSAAGTPFAVPLWFTAHRGRIYATTSASSWTVRNVAACPQVALLFGGERTDVGAERLFVRGCARAVRGSPPPAVVAGIAWRYYLQPSFAAVEMRHIALWKRRMQYYGQSPPAYLVITPQAATTCHAP